MPTGYTAPVVDGDIDTLEAFALNCARAFGALVNFRDHTIDADNPITSGDLYDSFNVDYYHGKWDDAIANLDEFLSKSDEELRQEYDEKMAEQHAKYADIRHHNAVIRDRLNSMLDKVSVWKIPDELSSLKQFMTEQLETTLKYDGREPERKYYVLDHEFDEWRAERARSLGRDVTYYHEQFEAAVDRRDSAVDWYKMLLESL